MANRLKRAISEATERAGWTFRVVFLPFQATRSGLTISRALVPQAFRTWPSRRFWGLVYIFSIFGLIVATFAAVGGVATDPEVRAGRNGRRRRLVGGLGSAGLGVSQTGWPPRHPAGTTSLTAEEASLIPPGRPGRNRARDPGTGTPGRGR
jgi:hypothetical protein